MAFEKKPSLLTLNKLMCVCVCVCYSLSHIWLFAIPRTVAHQGPLWNSPGKKTGVGSHSLLQGIFPTQGSNTNHLYFRQILYHLSHKENSNFNSVVSSQESILRKYLRLPSSNNNPGIIVMISENLSQPLSMVCLSTSSMESDNLGL